MRKLRSCRGLLGVVTILLLLNVAAGLTQAQQQPPRTLDFGAPSNASGYGEQNAQETTINVFGPGRNHGNSGGWSIFHAQSENLNCWRRGICQGSLINLDKAGVGDGMLAYWYMRCLGGLAAQSDEGCGGLGWLISEPPYFHGHLTAGKPGSQLLAPVFDSGGRDLSDGAFLLDTNRSTATGQLTGDSQLLLQTRLPGRQDVLLNWLPVAPTQNGPALPLTQSWCTALSDSKEPVVPDPRVPATGSTTRTLSCRVQAVAGVYRPLERGVVSVAGQYYPEQAPIIAAGVMDPVSHLQSLTLKLRNPNLNLAIFQGGLAGSYCNSDSDLQATAERQSYYAFGSLTGHDLIYGYNINGTILGRLLPVRGATTWTKNSVNGGFHCYPGAEITSTGDQTDGLPVEPTLEPNNVAWTPGDLVENPHYPAHGGKGGSFLYSQETPCDPSATCDALDVYGGGKGFVGNAHLLVLGNLNPPTYYKAGGGAWIAPPAIDVPGSYGTFAELSYTPQAGFFSDRATLFRLKDRAGYVEGQSQGSNAPFDLFEFGWSAKRFGFDPAEDRFYIDTLAISGQTEVTDAAAHTTSHAIASTNYVDRAVTVAVHGFTGDKTTGTCTFHIVDGLIQSVTGC